MLVLSSISPSTQLLVAGLLLAGIAYTFFHLILPRPLDGIPYNAKATTRVLGDLPDIKAFGSLTDWLAMQPAKHQSPLFQAFIRPFAKPWVVVADYHEAAEICTHRVKEFDRGDASTSIFAGVVPGGHITLTSSNPQFRKNKELVRNLMTPTFLSEASAPEIYDKFSTLVALWTRKSKLSNGRYFSASRDVHNAALDIIVCAAFGVDNQTTQLAKELQSLSPDESNSTTTSGDSSDEFVFKEIALKEELGAFNDLSNSLAKTAKTPSPRHFHFLYRNLSPTLRKAFLLARRLQHREITNGIKRRQAGEAQRCAIDEILARDDMLAAKEGRKPNYYSEMITSERVSQTSECLTSLYT